MAAACTTQTAVSLYSIPDYRSAADSTLMQNTISSVSVFSEGLSILLTIPVAFILCLLLYFAILAHFAFSKRPVLFAADGDLCIGIVFRYGQQLSARPLIASKVPKSASEIFRSRLHWISMNLRSLCRSLLKHGQRH